MAEKSGPSRRGFLRTGAVLAGAASLAGGVSLTFAQSPATQSAGGAKRTATDQVPLGKTGLMLSRLGLGTGSNNGHVQTQNGKDEFTKLVHYAFDQGITYIDCAHAYATHSWIAEAIKGLPREKIFLQSKVDGQPQDVLAAIDKQRSVYQTDYIDSLLVHCMMDPKWTDQFKRVMDAFDQAKEKKWIRAKGVSCHTLPALRDANRSDWNEVHLVRINPLGIAMDSDKDDFARPAPVDPIVKEIAEMHAKGRGVIGMKIIGNGWFTDPKVREKSIRFAMANPNIDAVVIGMKNRQEIDENLAVMNRALATA